MFEFLTESSYIIESIIEDYRLFRIKGESRKQAIDHIYDDYACEFNDDDDRLFAEVAVALALCAKRELTPQIRNKALDALVVIKGNGYCPDARDRDFEKLANYISKDRIGTEASYRMRKKYNPAWEIGDTFIHKFSDIETTPANLSGWFIIFRKVGEYISAQMKNIQLVYITVCPPDSVPKTDEELKALGCLRLMKHDNGWDYLGQISFSSKKDEERWQLKMIGNFPKAGAPVDATAENPLVTYPFWGIMKKDSDTLCYETMVRDLLKWNGIGKEMI